MANTRLQRFLAEAPAWDIGAITHVAPLAGGLTNANYRLSTASGDYVLRINHPQSHLLGINRHLEQQILNSIAGESYAPEIAYCCPRYHYLLSVYFDSDNLFNKPATPSEVEQLTDIVQQYRQISVDAQPRDYLNLLDSYANSAAERRGLAPETGLNWRDIRPELKRYCEQSRPALLCHHDLNPDNIVRSGGSLKIIDWEFASLGHPLLDLLKFDLLNVREEADYEEAVLLDKWLSALWLALRSSV